MHIHILWYIHVCTVCRLTFNSYISCKVNRASSYQQKFVYQIQCIYMIYWYSVCVCVCVCVCERERESALTIVWETSETSCWAWLWKWQHDVNILYMYIHVYTCSSHLKDWMMSSCSIVWWDLWRTVFTSSEDVYTCTLLITCKQHVSNMDM